MDIVIIKGYTDNICFFVFEIIKHDATKEFKNNIFSHHQTSQL